MPRIVAPYLARLAGQMRQQGIRRLLVITGEAGWCSQQARQLAAMLPGDWLWLGEGAEFRFCCAPRAARTLQGREIRHAVMDARRGLDVQALAILAGALAAGSFLVLLTPCWQSWQQQTDLDSLRWNNGRRPCAAPQFIRHFQHCLQQDAKVIFCVQPGLAAVPPSSSLSLPWRRSLPYTWYSGFALTKPLLFRSQQAESLLSTLVLAKMPAIVAVSPPAGADWQPASGVPLAQQQQILQALLAMSTGVAVVSAARGRGKSALAGMLLARLAATAASALVTAPARAATAVIARHSGGQISFIAPDALLAAPPAAADWLIIDEAAALPGAQLHKLIDLYPRTLLTTTLDGYEGTGRGFLLKFCASVAGLRHYRLSQPVRWAAADPLERVISNALLFDTATDERLFADQWRTEQQMINQQLAGQETAEPVLVEQGIAEQSIAEQALFKSASLKPALFSQPVFSHRSFNAFPFKASFFNQSSVKQASFKQRSAKPSAAKKPSATKKPSAISGQTGLADNVTHDISGEINRNRWQIFYPEQSQWQHNPQQMAAVYRLLTAAHYRTSPQDLRRMMDAPGQRFIVACVGQQVVAALWAVAEGGLPLALSRAIWAGVRRPAGNLFAQSLAAHGSNPRAACLRGLRISRIVVQSCYQRQGLGSQLIRAAIARAGEFQYLSVSFGYADALWRFWQHNGFCLLRIGSQRQASSGCYSAMAMLPLQKQSQRLARVEHRQLQLDAGWLRQCISEPPSVLVAVAGSPSVADQTEDTLTAADWLMLAGFAFAHRPLATSIGSLHRLLLNSSLPLLALRASISQRQSVAQVCRKQQLSGAKALLALLREQTGQALQALDNSACQRLRQQICRWQSRAPADGETD